MMMAFDSSQTPPSRLDEGTVSAVRAALRTYIADSAHPELLQHALVALSSEARAKAILPEHVLMVLKDMWHGLPEVRAMQDGAEQVRMLQRVVSMCIREYYSA
jgi:hypothetical protein